MMRHTVWVEGLATEEESANEFEDSTTSRLELGSRTYDATTILEDEKKGLSR